MTSLSSLYATAVRNLAQAELTDLGTINVFYGENGAGKTSVLEALHLLGTGRSFRSRSISSVIQHGCAELMVRAQTRSGGMLAIAKSDAQSTMKIDQERVNTTSALAAELPLLVLDGNIVSLIAGSPSLRRRYVDWILFHVEHSQFWPQWKNYQRLLKQRNELLKRGNIRVEELKTWDVLLAASGEKITEFRQAILEQCLLRVVDLGQGLSFIGDDLVGHIRQGWSKGESLLSVLEAGRHKDINHRTTSVGPHRFDFSLRSGEQRQRVSEFFSAGQLKTLAILFHVAAVQLVASRTDKSIVLLIDDLFGELDAQNKRFLLRSLLMLDTQIFVTCVNKTDVTSALMDETAVKLFHVEQGVVVNEKSYE